MLAPAGDERLHARRQALECRAPSVPAQAEEIASTLNSSSQSCSKPSATIHGDGAVAFFGHLLRSWPAMVTPGRINSPPRRA